MEEKLKNLKEFNKGAKEIFESSFNKKCMSINTNISWNDKDKKLNVVNKIPDIESIKAYCNDLRKFIQPNDLLCINKLIPIYQLDCIKDTEKKLFNQQMSAWEKYKKKDTIFKINQKKYTNEELFEIFLYGKIVHRTPNTSEKFDYLEKQLIFKFIESEFVVILRFYLILISNIYCINKTVIDYLEK